MKKEKIMLLAIAIMAVVGGALAFESKKFDTGYCIGPVTANISKVCNTFAVSMVAGTKQFYYRTTNSFGQLITTPGDCLVNRATCPLSGLLQEE